jgi:hypothetical protein
MKRWNAGGPHGWQFSWPAWSWHEPLEPSLPNWSCEVRTWTLSDEKLDAAAWLNRPGATERVEERAANLGAILATQAHS